MSDADRHRLRIEAKKLRYAVDFFAPLYREAPAREQQRDFARILARLQDSLGSLNDMAIAMTGRSALFCDLDSITAARLEAELEGLLAAPGQSRRHLLEVAEKSLSRIRGASPWWKIG